MQTSVCVCPCATSVIETAAAVKASCCAHSAKVAKSQTTVLESPCTVVSKDAVIAQAKSLMTVEGSLGWAKVLLIAQLVCGGAAPRMTMTRMMLLLLHYRQPPWKTGEHLLV